MGTAVKVALLVATLAVAGCRTHHHHDYDRGRAMPAEYQKCQVPRAVGLDHDAAEAIVLGAHLTPRCLPGHEGICTSQKPDPGAWLTCGEVVELTFQPPEYRKVIPTAPK
jgi:hypothetical protein